MGGGASASEDASPWSAIAVLVVTAVLSALAVAMSKRNSGARRAVAAAAVHFSVFSFAYACTPFGAPPDSGRYFFALVPAFCLVLGIGLSAASALFPRGAARRIAQVAVLVALCASAAPASYGSEFIGFFEHVVNIRANPGDQKGNVGTIPAYTPVTMKPVSSAYAEVTYEGAHGYVYTGQVLVAVARAAVRMKATQQFGAYTMIEIPPICMLPGDEEQLIRTLV